MHKKLWFWICYLLILAGILSYFICTNLHAEESNQRISGEYTSYYLAATEDMTLRPLEFTQFSFADENGQIIATFSDADLCNMTTDQLRNLAMIMTLSGIDTARFKKRAQVLLKQYFPENYIGGSK